MMKPLIGVLALTKEDDINMSHLIGDKYVRAVAEAAGAHPVIIPPMGEGQDFDGLLGHLDGVMLTGGASNMEPSHYGEENTEEEVSRDAYRDHAAMELARRAVAAGVPLFGICRGIQEINVAFGGSLHQELHKVPGRKDHRSDKTVPWVERYEPRETISIQPGGLLSTIWPHATAEVNSLHGQGIAAVGDGLRVEALADDGTVEAVSVIAASNFALGVQWHPEWKPLIHDFYKALFTAFGEAAAEQSRRRTGLKTAAE